MHEMMQDQSSHQASQLTFGHRDDLTFAVTVLCCVGVCDDSLSSCKLMTLSSCELISSYELLGNHELLRSY